MATGYGQPPHFDLSRPFFSPVLRIEYGNSVGSTRMELDNYPFLNLYIFIDILITLLFF